MVGRRGQGSAGLFRVVMVKKKAGKIRFYSRSGKSQGVLYQVREFLNSCSKSEKVREFYFLKLFY